jgi:hypothetical protein
MAQKSKSTPDGIAREASAETPMDRAERQILDLKSATGPAGGWAELTECGKLDRLDTLDWHGVTPLERLVVTETAVDLTRVSPRAQRNYLGKLRDQAMATLRPSITESILADPKIYLTQEKQNGEDRDHDNGHSM